MPETGRNEHRRFALAVAAVAALLVNQFVHVSGTNFGGVDEWLFLSLNSKGLLSIPHANRPLTLLWSQPAIWLVPASFEGYRWLHAAYLALSACLVVLLVRRLLPSDRGLAYLAGVAAAAWAPLDMGRLATVQVVVASGVVCGTLVVLLLYVESWRRAHWPLLLFCGLLAVVVSRTYEGVLGLLAAAPLLMPFVSSPREPGRWRPWVFAWALVVGIVALLAAWPLLTGNGAAVYQSSVMGLDLHPGRYALRLLRQYLFLLAPLVRAAPPTLGDRPCLIAIALFLAGAWAAGLWRPAPPTPRRRLLALCGLGLVLIALAVGPVLASPALDTPTRTQVFAGAGCALFLAAGARLLSQALPRIAGQLLLTMGGVYLVALGTAHTLAMQEAWNRITYYPVQHATLQGIQAVAPRLRPHTLVVLIDESKAWPFSFTFRHALSYVYCGNAVGHVLGADQFLYQLNARPSGLESVPWPVVRGPWKEQPDSYRFDEVVAFRLAADGRLTLVEEWGGRLPESRPESLRYAPRSRVEAGLPCSQAAVLGR